MKRKSLTALLAAAVMAFAMVPCRAAADYDPKDADRDGDVDIMDVIFINRCLIGTHYVTDVSILDANENLIVDSLDSRCIMNYLVDLTYHVEFIDIVAEMEANAS
ncbi:MAG: hypothetical protein IJ055_00275 [Oscillospiraceae bacterium]|nr:hypothetical protein [Oscillospiraceae bacterium]